MKREVFINSTPEEHRVVVLEDGRVVEIEVEAAGKSVVGNIYRGRVDKVVPGMQAAFVSIGLERDAFLHVGDTLAPDDEKGERNDQEPALIEAVVRAGQEVVVQITREPLPGKGARITMQLTLPGKNLVLVPGDPHIGVSRKITDETVRNELRTLLEEQRGEGSHGCIVRTAAEGEDTALILAERQELVEEWESLAESLQEEGAPRTLSRAAELPLRTVREILGAELERLVVDDEDLHGQLRELVSRRAPDLVDRVHLHEGEQALFEQLGLERKLEKALRPKVWLKSGGYLVIDQLEALVAIDVNSGKFTSGKRLEETALKVNLEAATEVGRQLRLRDLGGIIVIDFIDMLKPEERQAVMDALLTAMQVDRAKATVLPMSDFCLVQLTRQRRRRSLERQLCEPCHQCHGTGRIRSLETLTRDILRELRHLAIEPGQGDLTVTCHPAVAEALSSHLAGLEGGPSVLPMAVDVRSDGTRSRLSFDVSGKV